MNQEVITLEKVQETIPAVEIVMKQCRRKDCMKFKPITEFHKCPASSDKLRSYCKICVATSGKIYHEKARKEKLKLKEAIVQKAIKEYKLDESELRQCQINTCEKFKPLNEFGVSMSYPDGYSPICKDCVLKGTIKDAINKEFAQKAIENYVHPDDIIFRPIPFDDFCRLKLISREHPPISEYFIGRKIKNPYQLPTDGEYIHTDEYVYGEPASSHKDFIQLTAPDRSYQEKAEAILENWNELAEVA